MPADLLCQGTLIFLIFHLLNAVLWTLHASAIPRRDLIAAVVGLLSLVVATSTTTTTRKQAKLERTKRFTKYFQILSVSEVVVLVLIPWIVIVKEARSNISDGQVHLAAHLLAPHLFVFQEQIALESVITMQSIHRPMLLFQYTCLANMYRGIPLAIGFGADFWQKKMLRGRIIRQVSRFFLLLRLSCGFVQTLLFCLNGILVSG